MVIAPKYLISFSASPVGLARVSYGRGSNFGGVPWGTYTGGPGIGYGDTLRQMSKYKPGSSLNDLYAPGKVTPSGWAVPTPVTRIEKH
jgi:hypothetical protein